MAEGSPLEHSAQNTFGAQSMMEQRESRSGGENRTTGECYQARSSLPDTQIVQLTLEQHGSELHRSTYLQIFSINILESFFGDL